MFLPFLPFFRTHRDTRCFNAVFLIKGSFAKNKLRYFYLFSDNNGKQKSIRLKDFDSQLFQTVAVTVSERMGDCCGRRYGEGLFARDGAEERSGGERMRRGAYILKLITGPSV